MPNTTPRLPLLALSCLALAACGGGGTDGALDSPTEARAAIAAVPVAAGTSGGQPAAGDVVVMLSSGADIASVAARVGARVADRFGQRPIWRLQLPAGAGMAGALATLRADSRVRFAEANAAMMSPEGRKALVWAFGGNEHSWQTQWAPQALALPQAHAISTGAGVRVAVLDSGFDLGHPALAGRWATTGAGTLLGGDFVDGDADPVETASPAQAGWGHGTHVAGLVALAAPGARMMPVRVLDASGRGNAWVLAEALMWAIDPDGNPATDDGARVVNISLGTTTPTRLLDVAVELATCSDDDDDEDQDDYSDPGFDADRERCNLRHGVVVLAAAGNGGNATERQYPAAEGAEGQLAVTATRADGQLAGFANRGPWVQLAAPGQAIVSTLPGGAWGSWSGTSMATPLASGVAALVLSVNPDWKPVDVTKRLHERSLRLCGQDTLRGLHAHGAVADFVPGDPGC